MRLIGYVDGTEVSFTFVPPNQFVATIPSKGSGIYIVELHLYGDNFTVTHETRALVGIDFRNISFKFLDLKYKNLAGKLEREYEEQYDEFEEAKFIYDDYISDYTYKVI
jgi:hypothetical protein